MTHKFLEYHGLTAKDFISKLEEDMEIEFSAPINLEEIVNFIGAKLDISVDFEKISTAGSVSLNNDHAEIWINPIENSYEPRKRFTIAHEIGHLIRHISPDKGVQEFIDTKKTLNRKDSYWDSKEYEANNFAAQLLMPLKLIKKHGNEIISQYKLQQKAESMPASVFITRMASLFNVSEPAMKFRLKNIGAIK